MEMSPYVEYFTIIAKFVPRTYFAPLTGAIRGIREEYARIKADEQAAIAEWERKYGEGTSSHTPPAT
jgi:hypothetical protein